MENVKGENGKRGRGRPQIYDVDMVRGSFRIPVTVVQTVKEAGGGNVTLGLIRLAKLWQDSQKKSH